MAIVRGGLDIAKLVFQVHGVDEHGRAKLQAGNFYFRPVLILGYGQSVHSFPYSTNYR
jgi:hypothetical protein